MNPFDTSLTRQMTGAEELAYSQRGKVLINQFSILLKTARLHAPDNDLFKSQLEQCYTLFRENLHELGEASLQLRSEYLFFCGVRVRYDNDGLSAPDHLRDLFRNVGISGFLTASDLNKVEVEQMIMLLNEADRQGGVKFEELQLRFDLANISSIGILPPVDDSITEDNREKEKRLFARRTFFYALNNLKMVANSISADRPAAIARTKRVIHSLVDQIVSDEGSLLELTALKSHDQYTFLHSTNVCIYAVCLGARLAMTKSELSSLGFSALFHDIGKMQLPLELLNKPAAFNDADWEQMRRHPSLAVCAMAKTMPFEERCCRAMLVASEHHHNLDGSGYPTLKRTRPPNLYSRIVTICDVFDAMASGRVYRRIPASPENVLKALMMQAGYKFDPLLIKVFFNTVSVYPPGTMLLLDRQDIAIVVGKNVGDPLHPKVKIIGTVNRLYERGIRVNLADRNRTTGDYLRSIVRTIEPQELKVNTARYLLEEE